ncbi:MAG: hypothetical protein WD232_07755 [Acidimicrobiales bacterium]
MNDQLQLVDGTERPWRLDARTRAAGRRGVAQAREALRKATAHQANAHQATTPTNARGRAA